MPGRLTLRSKSRLLLVPQKRYRRLGGFLVDLELHFTILVQFADRRGVVGATATGDDAVVKDTRFGVYEVFILGRAEDHHGEFVANGVVTR